MKQKSLAVALCLSAPMAGLWAAGCGDDEVFRKSDVPVFDASTSFEASTDPDSATPDSSTGLGCGNATGTPQRLLLSINNTTTSELAAFNVEGKVVEGRLTYPGFIGLTSSLGSDPYLLEQATDVIARLDAKKPWQVVSSWSVAGDDKTDGGKPNANPVSVVVPDCSKGYVFRYNRNKVAVIDTTKVADGGAAESYLDLSPLVQPNDTDGFVDMVAALYVPTKKRIYVLLGNNDLKKVAGDGFTALCADTKPSVVAIDSSTGQLVSLGGTAPGGGIALEGYSPILGTPLAYDAARDRLIVLSAGCNTDNGGVPGAIQRRRVEEVDLATKQVKTLLSLDTEGFPQSMVFIDGSRAAISFYGQAFFWNPTQATLGAEIPGGLDYAAHDGKGSLIGARATYLGDGGAGPIEVVRVPYGDSGVPDAASVVKLGENPFTNNGGFMSGAEMWPRP